MSNNPEVGKVYLVGSGPGDPGLITVRGKELLARADVVIFDYLADASLLTYCNEQAQLIDVGKRPGRPVPQDEINAVLIQSVLQYGCVVRLKGGDPFVFGRGGEEALALTAAGISFEVVPGITSAVAVPAYAGIPVTHRGLSTSFTVVTGHRHGNATDQVDWDSLAKLGGTIVILMGVAHRAEIADKLISGGLAPGTPVAAVRWGTRGDQLTVRTTLGKLGNTEIKSPATIVVGSVASLNLNWFENKPLLGKRIVVTRSKEQAPVLTKGLRERGAIVLSVPTIALYPPSDDYAALKKAVSDISKYQWLIFTSPNAVSRFFKFISDVRILAGIKIAAIGNATAAEIERYKIVSDFVPSKFMAENFVREFGAGTGRVLIPRAAVGREVLPDGLKELGWKVDIVEVYQTLPAMADPSLARDVASSDAILFASSSSVSNFIDLYGVSKLARRVISIGPVTTATLNGYGVFEVITAEEHDVNGLIEALVQAFGNDRN